MQTLSSDDSWQAVSPRDALPWLSLLPIRWWVAGGWALSLFAESSIRTHTDLDIGVLRQDAPVILEALSSWEIFEAKDGVLSRLDHGRAPRIEVNSLWCRSTPSDPWAFELMLDESAGEHWVFRRNRSIRRSLESAIRHDPTGIPYLSPEIQLLYKSKAFRPKDQHDFDRIARRLDISARKWLKDVLCLVEPHHPWLDRLTE